MTGAILGVGWIAEGRSPLHRPEVLNGFLVPLMASPVMAVGLSLILAPFAARVGRWLDARCLCAVPSRAAILAGNGSAPFTLCPASTVTESSSSGPVVGHVSERQGQSSWMVKLSIDHLHWASSALVAVSRGLNDSPKIWGLVIPVIWAVGALRGSFLSLAVVGAALSMGVGSWVAGRRVTHALAVRITSFAHEEGFDANLATALLVAGASRLGLAVSTTHVSSGAIVGAGLARRGRQCIEWRVLFEFALAWLVTLPVGALVAVGCYELLK